MSESYESLLREAFPEVESGVIPLGSRVMVQIRTPKTKTASGIIFVAESRETEKWNTTTAKVISKGPLAFKNRDTLSPWPEGDWVSAGDYIRCPKYGGDRFEIPIGDGTEDAALFVIFNDLDIIAKIEGDPLSVRAFL
jgi:co-chaperonin GroES (HSP10)